MIGFRNKEISTEFGMTSRLLVKVRHERFIVKVVPLTDLKNTEIAGLIRGRLLSSFLGHLE